MAEMESWSRGGMAGSASGVVLVLVLGAVVALLVRMAMTGSEATAIHAHEKGAEPVAAPEGGAEPQGEPREVLYRVGNTKCPIMGGAVEANRVYVEGIEIGICCRPCEQDIHEDPGGTIRKLMTDPDTGPGLAAWLDAHPEVARKLGIAAPKVPDAVAAKAPAPGRRVTALANPTCLIDGEELRDPVLVEVGGLVVGLCRRECARAFEQDPESALDRAARRDPKLRRRIEAHRDLVARGGHGPHWSCAACVLRSAAPGPCPSCGEALVRPADEPVYLLDNLRCPVMGDPVVEGAVVVHRGIGVRICCPSCIATFEQNPGYYLAKVEREEGVRIPRLVEEE